jgi:ribosomal protein S18 acetylase RimI-like enzyme
VDIRIEKRTQLDAGNFRRLMADSDPWRSLDYGDSDLEAIARSAAAANLLVATREGKVVGLCMSTPGVLLGEYLKLLVVDAACRGNRIGSRLLDRMEACAFRQWPNVYLCVSDFNEPARRFLRPPWISRNRPPAGSARSRPRRDPHEKDDVSLEKFQRTTGRRVNVGDRRPV